jgi:hypothetical protein
MLCRLLSVYGFLISVAAGMLTNKVDLAQVLKYSSIPRRSTMNGFIHHHRDLIHFGYSCFDRIICNGLMPQFRPARCGTIVWFLRNQRQVETLNRAYFAKVAREYHDWLVGYAQQAGVAIVQPEKDVRREEWIEPYYQQLGQRTGIAVILRVRECERMVVHFAKSDRIAVIQRFPDLYYFYLNDADCGRMFVRLCPYFPFNIRVWMNGHNWLARRLEREGIAFDKRDNLFVDCANPQRLQEWSDAFGPQDLAGPVAAWVARLLPFFSEAERQRGYRHQLYMTQMEYCNNLIFHKRAAAHKLLERLMDANRSLGHPDKLAVIFGRGKFRADTRTGQTVVKMTKLRTPVISSSYQHTSIKQYVSHGVGLRTESTSYQLGDLHIKKNTDNLPKVREVLGTANQRYLDVQQDVLASYIDRGQLQELLRPTISATGRRVPGLHLDDPRLLALLQALTCFMYLSGKGSFRTKDLLVDAQKALDKPDYQMSQLRYDLNKLRGKGLVVRQQGTHTYQLTPEGYQLAILYLKLYHRLYAPLTAGLRDPVPADNAVLSHRQTKLDRLYVGVDKALQKLTEHIGVAA